MIKLDLDSARQVPEWDFTVETGGKIYTTRLAKLEELKAISSSTSFEETCNLLNNLILEPGTQLAGWGPQRVAIFMAGYVQYLKLYSEKFKAAMSLDWVSQNIAGQMGN